ncbi:MAG: response regulator transcription factor [Burkholderiaceae bacterium]|nr:response regulator transcription factor [Burkholderiaceae bacterium]
MTLAHIAILDDEPDITALLGAYLSSHGHRVTELHHGAALLELLQRDAPALVLLDLGLPGEDGLAIARQVREFGNIGLVIVSGRGDAVDKVVGLEIGADDYITKPFDLRELLARVRAVLRRTAGADGSATHPVQAANDSAAPCDSCHFAGFTLELAARRLLGRNGVEVALTAGEFDLLSVFVQHPGRVLSRDFLLERTRGREAAPFDRAVDVLVGRLRKKLGDDLQQPQLLKAVRSAGYLLVATAGRR